MKIAQPFSTSRRAGSILFLSGQIGLKNGRLSADFAEQVRQTVANIESELKKHDLSLGHVLDVTAFLTNMDNYNAFNEAYGRAFADPYPARTCVEVSALPFGALVELKVTASLEN